MKFKALALTAAGVLATSACATTSDAPSSSSLYQPSASQSEDVERLRRSMQSLGGQTYVTEADAGAMSEVSSEPLGSRENPVRAAMPVGQRRYLDRLRCSDGKAPSYERSGSAGAGPYGSIIDLYVVQCPDAEPSVTEIYIDMYHRHVETEAVPGFDIVPPGTLPAT